ncbi:MAG: Ada metal-binding domain-containing protein [bacterium]
MRMLCGLVVVGMILASWMGIAQAQDQSAAPAKGAAMVEEASVVTEGVIETEPEAAEAPKKKESSAESGAAEAPSTAPFIGNKSSKKVHRADCKWGSKTSPRNRIYFNTYEEAEKAGYIPCKGCKPQLAAKGIGAAKSKAPASAEEGYYASVKGKAFHRPSCRWAGKISPANLVKYKTREEAIAAGKKPCSTCKP